MARTLANEFNRELGERFVVDNRTGAAGNVGILNGPPIDTFFVNGTSGGANRTVVVPVGQSYTTVLASPPGFSGAGYAMFGRIGRPTPPARGVV